MNELEVKMNLIKEFTKHVDFAILGPNKDMIMFTIIQIEKDIICSMNNENVVATEEFIIQVRNVIEFFFYIYFEIYIGQPFYDFVTNYVFLVINWNNNIAKDDTLGQLCKRTDMTYMQYHMIEQLLQQSKRMLDILKKDQKYEFVPEVSKHYLKAFVDKEK